jgi:starvation-inducible DNA-binding protein
METSGPNFYELHLLFEKHYGDQEQLIYVLAERVQTLGGVARALASDVVEETRLVRAPSGVESAADQLRRLVDAPEFLWTRHARWHATPQPSATTAATT